MKGKHPTQKSKRFANEPVTPKKHLGQHFLRDDEIAFQITNLLSGFGNYQNVLEIGPGTGVLTKYLVKLTYNLLLFEIDTESVSFLAKTWPELKEKTIASDFLKADPALLFNGRFAIIGNFPYNISSQIFFRILEYHKLVPEVVCMLQKEVAERLAAGPGSKTYGILSVLLQTWYNIEYAFTVNEDVFVPPPKVKSGVIRLRHNGRETLACTEKALITVVKQGFNNRRKTLRNALKPLNLPESETINPFLDLRAEQLSVDDFINIAVVWEMARN